MTYLRHLTLFQLEQLYKEKEAEKAEYKKSIANQQHFSYGAIRLFRKNVTRLNGELKEIKSRIELHPDYQKTNYKKFKAPAL